MSDPCAGVEYRFRDRAAHLIAEIDAALERGEIDEAGWHSRIADILRPAYLAAPDERAQSGYLGTAAEWENARGLIADAIDRDGSFLDVGCANGLLMESMVRWTGAKGLRVEPFGLEIVPELAALARTRLPRWADRIFVGNALGWRPGTRFDFVRTGLEYVPSRRRRDLVAHLLERVVAADGRLILGVYGEDRAMRPGLEDGVRGWGYVVAGRSERPHRSDASVAYRAFWIDGPSRGAAPASTIS